MRLAKVSLLVLAVLTVVNGCSQSRDSVRRGRTGELRAPAPSLDYTPGAYESNPGYQPVVPHVPPAQGFEPPRVPPAVGISRVKSVGFPRLLPGPVPAAKSHCGEAAVNCCPVESDKCVPEAVGTPKCPAATICKDKCAAAPTSSEGCCSTPAQPSRLARFFAPFTRKFARKSALNCGVSCGSETCPGRRETACHGEKSQAAVGCGDKACNRSTGSSCVSGRPCDAKNPNCGCGDLPGLIAPGCGDRPWQDYATRSSHQPGLAESLQDPFLDNEAVQVPSGAQRAIPTVPLFQIPEDVPVPPAIYVPNSSTQLVIPPQWPRLTQNNYAGISTPAMMARE